MPQDQQQQGERHNNSNNRRDRNKGGQGKHEDPHRGDDKQQGGGRGGRGGRGRGGHGRGGRGGDNREHNRNNNRDNQQRSSTTTGGGDNAHERSQHKPKPVFETAKGGARGKRHGYGAKNTESFEPSHEPPTLRIQVDVNPDRISVPVGVRDVTYHPLIFTKRGDEMIYEALVKEIKDCSVPNVDLLKSWHGDTHWIADDKTGWKKECPTFTMCVKRLADYFQMDVKATRFNWYKDQSEWKPFHHDAAAVKPDKAKTQNFTVAVSFGSTREAAFEEVESKKVISMPQPNGSVYTFARDVNIMWKHGILQVPPKQQKQEGRISIILWGWIDQEEVGQRPKNLY